MRACTDGITVADENCSKKDVARIKRETKDFGILSVLIYRVKLNKQKVRGEAEDEPIPLGDIPEKAATVLNLSQAIR